MKKNYTFLLEIIDYSVLSEHIGGTINTKIITQNWDEILRLATSIKNGTVTASLIIRKIGSYPRQTDLQRL